MNMLDWIPKGKTIKRKTDRKTGKKTYIIKHDRDYHVVERKWIGMSADSLKVDNYKSKKDAFKAFGRL